MPYKDPVKRAEYAREYYREYMPRWHAAHKEHNAEKQRAWRKQNPDYAMLYMQRVRLKKFGITLDDFIALLKEQEGLCAICRQPETQKHRARPWSLSVDHDHQTGKVRGLLCTNCNNGLGRFHDSVENLERALAYLKEHKRTI